LNFFHTNVHSIFKYRTNMCIHGYILLAYIYSKWLTHMFLIGKYDASGYADMNTYWLHAHISPEASFVTHFGNYILIFSNPILRIYRGSICCAGTTVVVSARYVSHIDCIWQQYGANILYMYNLSQARETCAATLISFIYISIISSSKSS
jgi:hypothetical protein